VTRCAETGIGYDRAGEPGSPIVVLIHAGIADRRMWEPQWGALCRTYDTIRLDLRGFGESEQPPAGALVHHQDVINTLAALEVRSADLVACSFGSGIAVEVALAQPQLVRSLHLTTPGGYLIADWTSEFHAFADAERAALSTGDIEAAVQANLDWWVDGPHRSADAERAGVRELVATMQRRAFEISSEWEVDEQELEPPALTRLGDITVPTFILSGGLDLDAITIASKTLADQIPDARHQVWPDVAHLPSLERRADYTELLLRWLDRL
jgi:pimeloyl-ACP methyl ester carboxylesterase